MTRNRVSDIYFLKRLGCRKVAAGDCDGGDEASCIRRPESEICVSILAAETHAAQPHRHSSRGTTAALQAASSRNQLQSLLLPRRVRVSVSGGDSAFFSLTRCKQPIVPPVAATTWPPSALCPASALYCVSSVRQSFRGNGDAA